MSQELIVAELKMSLEGCEQKFDGIEALKAQIDADCGLARKMLANKGLEFS